MLANEFFASLEEGRRAAHTPKRFERMPRIERIERIGRVERVRSKRIPRLFGMKFLTLVDPLKLPHQTIPLILHKAHLLLY